MFTWTSSIFQNLPTNPSGNNRFAKKEDKERLYEQLFGPYQPTKQYEIHFINSITTEQELKNLYDVIKSATDFIFDTEADIRSRRPALIQVLIVKEDPTPFPLLLIETCFLPDQSSTRFIEIQKLFNCLFRPDTNLYSWGPLDDELSRFQTYQLFSLPICSQVFDVQDIFHGWFNDYLNIKAEDDNNDNTTINQDTLILNAPAIDPELFLPPLIMNRLKFINKQKWSLQDAIAYIFYQYLSKRDTLRAWSIGLDQRLSSRNRNYSFKYRQRLIKYAAYDCMSLMDIVLFMYNTYSINSAINDSTIKSLGEYFFYLNTKFASLFKSRQKIELFFDSDSDSDESMIVHELDERHQVPVEVQANEQDFDIIPQPGECETNEQIYDINQRTISLVYNVNPNPQTSEQSYDIHQQQQEVAYSVLNEQYLINHQLSDNYQSSAELHPAQVPDHSNIIPACSIKQKSKVKRSTSARKQRNQKTSRRHRKNRYNYEIIRPFNTTVTNAKRLLRLYAVPYVNVNPVQSTLYIGMKNQEFQDYFDKLLPMDLFNEL